MKGLSGAETLLRVLRAMGVEADLCLARLGLGAALEALANCIGPMCGISFLAP